MSSHTGFSKRSQWTYSTESVPLYHVSFSKNSQEIAVSQWDGKVQILSAMTGRISYTVDIHENTIVSCTRFHPNLNSVILSCCTSGTVSLYNISDSTSSWHIKEFNMDVPGKEFNNCYCCEFSPDASHFVTVGSDAIVRLYDTQSHQCTSKLSKNFADTPFYHSARVYSCVFDNSNSHSLFTGGWDTRVIMWDTRSGVGVQGFGGPNICGDSLDVYDNFLLTGAWRQKSPLELWDIRNGKCIKTGNWNIHENSTDFCQIYAAKFIKNEKHLIVAGGSDSQNFKIFDKNLQPLERYGFFDESINSIAVSPDCKTIIAASQNGKCQAFFNE